MDEEHDDLALGFLPDHYMTEYGYPGAPLVREIVGNLERHRCGRRPVELWRGRCSPAATASARSTCRIERRSSREPRRC